ncbi:K02A2.6-like [Cordylochernes scorpioides]|uniref:K02A2.6-like n=1 Tax=Cordylochernes scorpioides TaxID=51811 RepID=A0ABY6LQL4_9ARAC|nr:K02A2.6-like [Cordylochernes scorpioides]
MIGNIQEYDDSTEDWPTDIERLELFMDTNNIVEEKKKVKVFQTLIGVDPELDKVLTLNTNKGLYTVNRIPFGISSAPDTFQRIIDKNTIRATLVYLDNILISGKCLEGHLGILGKVLTQVLEYFDQIIDSPKVYVELNKKIEPFVNCPIPNDILSPLNWLLRENIRNVKKILVTEKVLVNYNPMYSLILPCDASSHGLGTMLCHKLPDNYEKTIAFASRTLSKASLILLRSIKNICTLKCFSVSVYGNPFTLLFGKTKSIPSLAAARIHKGLFSGFTYKSLMFTNMLMQCLKIVYSLTKTNVMRRKFFCISH